jgi:hypothetical protein
MRPLLGYFALGAGIVWGTAGLIALEGAGNAKSECSTTPPLTCSSKYKDMASNAETAALVSDISLGVAALAALGYFLLPGKTLKVAALPSAHGATAAVGGEFR